MKSSEESTGSLGNSGGDRNFNYSPFNTGTVDFCGSFASVFDVDFYGVFDVFEGLFKGSALCVTSGKARARRDDEPIFVNLCGYKVFRHHG